MIDTGADDWKAEGHIHAFKRLPLPLIPVIDKAYCLERDVSLIMIHGDNSIIQTAQGLTEH